MSNQLKGINFAILTAFISGVSIFVNKFAVGIVKPPLVFTTAKNLGVGILIFALILGLRKWKEITKLSRKDLGYLALIGIIGGSLPFYLYFTGLTQVPAINAALIHKTLVLWVIIMAVPFLKEKLSPLQLLGVGILFVSNLAIGGFKGFSFSTAEFFILAATILWAIENIIAKKILPVVDPDIVTAARMGFGSLILLTASLIVAPKGIVNMGTMSTANWLILGVTVLLLFGYVTTWYRALKFAPAITVASVLVASTLVTNILSAVFITKAWTLDMGIQSLAMLVGVALLWYVEEKRLLEPAKGKKKLRHL